MRLHSLTCSFRRVSLQTELNPPKVQEAKVHFTMSEPAAPEKTQEEEIVEQLKKVGIQDPELATKEILEQVKCQSRVCSKRMPQNRVHQTM